MHIVKLVALILACPVALVLLVIVAAVCFLAFSPSVGVTPDKAAQDDYRKKTDLFYDGQFHNDKLAPTPLFTGEIQEPSPRRVPEQTLPAVKITSFPRAEPGKLTATWLGHASVLLQFGASNIFLDPMLSDRASPLQFAGPKRFSELPLAIEDVPEIDVAFISHDHYDHLDLRTIKGIDAKVRAYVVPLGVDVILRAWGVDGKKIHALFWYESVELAGVTFTLTPAQHRTGRHPRKPNRTLWSGVHMTDGAHGVYYTGDTGYCGVFKEIRDRFGEVDLAILQNGQYDRGWAKIHMFPDESAQAIQELGAKVTLPVHWASFCICNHAWDEPIIELSEAAERAGFALATPRIGETVDYDEIEKYREKWWREYN